MGRTALIFCGVLLLAVGFWTALLPAVLGREATAADLIADQLPAKKTLKNATKSEFLGAVCAAVRSRHSAAAAITQAAVTARARICGRDRGDRLGLQREDQLRVGRINRGRGGRGGGRAREHRRCGDG